MDFWRSVQQAAEKAAVAAKDLGKKGLEVVEATAEEANKKLNLNLHDKVGAGPPKQAAPSPAELEAFGVTPDFADFVRTLNYSTFRDFPTEHLLPVDSSINTTGGDDGAGAAAASAAGSSGRGTGGPAYQLNPWQLRHATLVVQALKEVNELRFVLCPKYMTDEHFWHIYFTLARKNLPDRAFNWTASDVLPSFGEPAPDDAFSLAGLGSQLMQLGSKLQSATQAGRQRGLELSSFGGSAGGSAGATSSSGAGVAAAASAGTPDARPAPVSGMLEEDPDLEAYLQVAINTSHTGSGGEEEGSGYAVGDDDLDLDSYINELSAEVEAAAVAEEEEQAQHRSDAAVAAAAAAGEVAAAEAAKEEGSAAAAPAAAAGLGNAKQD